MRRQHKTEVKNIFYLLLTFGSIVLSAMTLFSQSIRLDEAQSLWISTKSLSQILYFDLQDVLVPLYEILLHFWIQLFGNSIFVARLLSFIFFLCTLPLLYIMGKEAKNEKAARLSVTLFSLSPFIMWYSSEARMYTLFALITVANHLFFLRFFRSNGKNGKLGYFFTTIVGLYTHYFFIFLVVTQVFFLLIRPLLALQEDTKKALFLFLKFCLLLSVSFIFFLPWAYEFVKAGSASNTQPLIPPPTSFNIFQTFINFIFGFQTNAIQAILISIWPLILLMLFLFFTRREREGIENLDYFVMTTFFPIILVFLGSFVRPIFLTRYLILVTPTLFFLTAWVLTSFIKKKFEIVVGIFLLVMFALLIYQNISTSTPVKEDYTEVSKYLEKKAKPEDIIAVYAPFTIYPIEYTYSGNTQITTIPYWDRYVQGAIPPYSRTKLIQQITGYTKQYKDLFVVLSYDQGYENDIKKYLDTHYKRLVSKTFSPNLEVREYILRYDIL